MEMRRLLLTLLDLVQARCESFYLLLEKSHVLVSDDAFSGLASCVSHLLSHLPDLVVLLLNG